MIRVEGMTLRCGVFALRDLELEVPQGEYAVLMGRTGSGKTSLLEALCGLRRLDAGRVWIGDREVSRDRPADRGLGYVPQDGALFPHLSVRRHLSFAPELRRESPSLVAQLVSQWAGRLGLEDLLDRRPKGLSGGERQKVALGRALASRPRVLLLDEPLAALDEQAWEQSLQLLGEVHRETGVTVLHVTHRSAEARALSTQRLRLEGGRIVPEDGARKGGANDGAGA